MSTSCAMDEFENLRKVLDEPPPSAEDYENARRAVGARYPTSTAPRRFPVGRLATLTAIIALVAVVLSIVIETEVAEAWSPVPVSPPDPSLLANASTQCAGDVGDGELLLLDQRGEVAVALFGEPGAESGDSSGFRTCTLVLEDEWRRASADDLPYRLAVAAGSVDEEVLGQRVFKVLISLPNYEIEVSYREGFYLIWWPEDVALKDETMQLVAENGSLITELPLRQSRSD